MLYSPKIKYPTALNCLACLCYFLTSVSAELLARPYLLRKLVSQQRLLRTLLDYILPLSAVVFILLYWGIGVWVFTWPAARQTLCI